jgi:predicted lipid carrier protein YhbT
MAEPWFDPENFQEQLKKRLANVPGQLAEGLSRVVRDAPEPRIKQVMRSPARRVVLDGIFWQIPQRFDQQRAGSINATLCWRITGRDDDHADSYWLRVADGRCRVLRSGEALEPNATITVDAVEFLQLVTGNSDPMEAYLKGRITISGDVMLAAQLFSLFKLPPSTGR